MEENEHLLPGSPFPREISSSENKKKRGASWFVKVLLVSLFLLLSVLGTVGFLSNAVVTREDEHQTRTKIILMKFLSLGDAGAQKAKEEKKAKNGFKIRVPFIRHHGSEKPRETSEKNTGAIEMAKRSLSKEHGNNEDLVKVMEENAKKRLLFKAAAERREGPARGLDEDENIAGDGESVGGDEQRRVSSPRAVSVSSSAEDDDDDDSNKRSPREQRQRQRQQQQTNANTNTKKNVPKAKNTNKEVPNYKSQAEANLRMIPTSLFDLFKSKEYEEEEKEEKSYFENNAKCENVFTLGLEGVGHHAFQMGKDAFVNTLLSDHLNNVIEKKKNTNNNNEVFKDIVEEHARQVDDMFNYKDEENEGGFWNLVQEKTSMTRFSGRLEKDAKKKRRRTETRRRCVIAPRRFRSRSSWVRLRLDPVSAWAKFSDGIRKTKIIEIISSITAIPSIFWSISKRPNETVVR